MQGKEEEIAPKDQRRGRDSAERLAQRQRGRRRSRGSHAEANSDCAETQRAKVIDVEVAEVMQRAKEAAQSLRGLTQWVSG